MNCSTMPSTAPRRRLLSPLALAVLVSVSDTFALAARAQEPEPEPEPAEPAPLSAAEQRSQWVAIGRSLDSEQWAAADAVLKPLVERLNYFEATDDLDALRCMEQVVNLRTANEY